KETIERSFAEAKELHGLRYARMLGIRNMYEQSFLTAAVQNMKRIARAFRFLFYALPYALRGCFLSKTAPLSAVWTVDNVLSTVFRCKAVSQPCSEGNIMFLCAKRTAGT